MGEILQRPVYIVYVCSKYYEDKLGRMIIPYITTRHTYCT